MGSAPSGCIEHPIELRERRDARLVVDVGRCCAIQQDAADANEQCDFCGTSPAADMDVLLDVFVSGLKTEFGDADGEGVYYDGREGGYQWHRTWTTAELVDDFADVLGAML